MKRRSQCSIIDGNLIGLNSMGPCAPIHVGAHTQHILAISTSLNVNHKKPHRINWQTRNCQYKMQ